jgi:hypothetical protein
VEDPYDGIKYYIASVTIPDTEESDSQFIADWGMTFPIDAGNKLFGVE